MLAAEAPVRQPRLLLALGEADVHLPQLRLVEDPARPVEGLDHRRVRDQPEHPVADLGRALPSARAVVRAMPNLPASVRKVATGPAASPEVTPAQKAAARSLTLSLAAELGPAGIRVATITINGILGTPGFEPRRIAQVYVDLATAPADTQWAPEVHWPEQSGSR